MPSNSSDSPDVNPFRGLLPFETEDSARFFGRDEEIEAVARLLRKQRFVAVTGVSGSGKSSLVRAGVLPFLQCGLTELGDVRVASMMPLSGPMSELHRALETALGAKIDRELLEATSFGLVDAVHRSGKTDESGGVHSLLLENESLVILVDQFEELFAFWDEGFEARSEAQGFVAALLEAAKDRSNRIYVVLTMRSDFLGKCSLFRNLPEALNAGTYLVPRMTRAQMRKAICEPLASRIEPLLVDDILNECLAKPEPLPVMEYVLWRMVERQKPGARGKEDLGFAEYRAVGPASSAIRRSADEAITSLREGAGREDPDRINEAVRLLFQRITELGPGGGGIRRPTSASELASLLGLPLSTPKGLTDSIGASKLSLAAILAEFQRRKLLVADVTSTDPRVDLPHECVTREWPELKKWMEAESADARAVDFIRISQEKGQYLGGTALDEGRALLGKLRGPWGIRRLRTDEARGSVVRFVEASSTKEHTLQVTRLNQKLAQWWPAAVLLVLAACLFALLARQEAQEANRIGEEARASQLAAESSTNSTQPEVQAGMARVAYLMADTLKTREAVFASMERPFPERILEHGKPGTRVAAVAVSPDGKWLATGGSDGRIRIWGKNENENAWNEVLDPEIRHKMGWVNSVAFAQPTSRETILATGGDDGFVRVWSINSEGRASGEPTTLLHTDPTDKKRTVEVWAVGFSPDGKILASGSNLGYVRLWDRERAWNEIGAAREAKLQGDDKVSPSDGIVSVAATCTDGSKCEQGEYLFAGAGEGRRVALWGKDGEVKYLDDHVGYVYGIAFNNEGTLLASAGWDGRVFLWDLTRQQPTIVDSIGVDTGNLWGLDFSPDGRKLAVGSRMGGVYLYRLEGSKLTSTESFYMPEGAAQVTFGSTDTELIAGSSVNRVRVWNWQDRKIWHKDIKLKTQPKFAGFTNVDASRLVVVDSEDKISSWEIQYPRAVSDESAEADIRESGKPLERCRVWSIATSPSSSSLVALACEEGAEIWQPKQTKPQRLGEQEKQVHSIALTDVADRYALGGQGFVSFGPTSGKKVFRCLLDETDENFRVKAVAWAPSSQKIAFAIDRAERDAVMICNAAVTDSDAPVVEVPLSAEIEIRDITALSFRGEEELVIGFSDGMLLLQNVGQPEAYRSLVRGTVSPVNAIRFNKDRSVMATIKTDEVVVWTTSDWEALRRIPVQDKQETIVAAGFRNEKSPIPTLVIVRAPKPDLNPVDARLTSHPILYGKALRDYVNGIPRMSSDNCERYLAREFGVVCVALAAED